MNLMAERFLYLSSFALSVAIAGIVIYLKSENGARNYSLVVIIILLIFSFLTFQRNKDWVSEEILFATGEGVDGTVLLVNSGNQYANSQKYDIAKEKYLRAIGIRDNNVLAHHNLGQIYILQNVLDSAEIHISRGIAIDSLAPDGYFQLSNLYQMMGRNEDAIPLLEKLQQIIPDYRGSLAVLNSLKSGETNELGLIPNSPAGNDLAVLQKRSYQLFQSGKFELAIKDLEKLVEIDPLSASGYLNNMAMCYIELKDFKKAEDKLNESIGLDAGNVNALSGLADVYLKTGRKKEAIEAYRKILAVNPKDENAMFKLDSLNK
jgi:tetratricopeptide (TPR) repeat protein